MIKGYACMNTNIHTYTAFFYPSKASAKSTCPSNSLRLSLQFFELNLKEKIHIDHSVNHLRPIISCEAQVEKNAESLMSESEEEETDGNIKFFFFF